MTTLSQREALHYIYEFAYKTPEAIHYVVDLNGKGKNVLNITDDIMQECIDYVKEHMHKSVKDDSNIIEIINNQDLQANIITDTMINNFDI